MSATRRKFVYRVVVDEYPPGSHVSQDDYDPWWKPEGWDPAWFPTGAPDDSHSFSWPQRTHYLSDSGAGKRCLLLHTYGAKAHVERSLPVEWPT